MPMFYTIETNGDVISQSLRSPPAHDQIRAALNGGYVEHVSVLFDGKPAHLFVDEDGLSKELPFNARASAVYSNVVLRRAGKPTYDRLTAQPPDTVVVVSGRPLIIVGRALLWTGKTAYSVN